MSIFEMAPKGHDTDVLATASPHREVSTAKNQRIVGHRMTTQQAMIESGLDFPVGLRPIFMEDGTKIDTHKATVRLDNSHILGVVGNRYRPVQNHEAFAFVDALVDEGNAAIETAGCFKGGRVVYLQARLPESFRVVGDDMVDCYLLFANGHDGSLSVNVKFTPIRVVCRNTLEHALDKDARFQISIKHSASALQRLEFAHRALLNARQGAHKAEILFQFLASKQVKEQRQLTEFWLSLVPDPEKMVGQSETPSNGRAKAKREDLQRLFVASPGNDMPGVRNTWWAAYNAATYMTSHGRDGTKRSDEAIAESKWFGAGEAFNQKALTLAHAAASRG